MIRKIFSAAFAIVILGGVALAVPRTRDYVAPYLPAFLAPPDKNVTGQKARADSGGEKAKSKKKGGGRAAPVIVATAVQRSVPITLEGVGTVKARATVEVKSQIEGQLIEARVHEGQLVKSGDVLFRLDARPLQARLREAQAALARDRANLQKAKNDFKRHIILSKQGYSPEARRDEAQALVDTTEAAVRASEAAVELATLNLNYATIRSPIDGRAGSILISVGNVVKANDSTPLLVITETKPVYVSFNLPERYLDELRQRMAGSQPTVEVTTLANSKDIARGKLFFINNEVDPTTGTIELLANFENADERLVPGQFARARVLMRTLENAVLIPSRAIQYNQKGRFVWLMKPNKTVELRAIETGPEDGSYVVVTKGVAAGDTIVTDGQLRLVRGAKVAPKNAAKPGGAKSGRKPDVIARESRP